MANELVLVADPAADSGLTMTANVLTSSGTSVSTGISCSESGSTAIYVGNFPTSQTTAGMYIVQFFSGGTLYGSGSIAWDGAAEITDQTTDLKAFELWQLQGLDASNPMTVTTSSRTAGDISQSIAGNGTTTSTVQRS